MMPPTSIDGTDITGATIDGTDVTEITLDGQTVFSAEPAPGEFMMLAFRQTVNDDLEHRIFQCSTPFDPGTATLFSGPTLLGLPNSEVGGHLNLDGTRLYIANRSTKDIHQFDLSTPFDLSSATETASINSGIDLVNSISLSNDGTQMAAAEFGSYRIWNLSTPFDINTANSVEAVTNRTAGFARRMMNYSPDGTKFYSAGQDNFGTLFQFNLSTPYDFTTRGSATTRQSPFNQSSDNNAIQWNADGTTWYLAGESGRILEFTGASNFDITTGTPGNTYFSSVDRNFYISFNR